MKNDIKALFSALTVLSLLFFSSCGNDETTKDRPMITWNDPADIKYGNPLGGEQLNAIADIAGSFLYSPDTGTILEVGQNQTLTAVFTPTNQAAYQIVEATVSINVIDNGTSTAVFPSNVEYGTVTDADGNAYKTVKIGEDTWMAENLRTTHYQNGDEITLVTTDATWGGLTSEAFCYYEHTDDINLQATYGALYNWYAVSDTRRIAPEGWHVATQDEWTALANEFGGLAAAASALKEAGTTHWEGNNGATNSSGFTALPSGRREFGGGGFLNIGFNGFWWTNSPYNPDYSWYYQMNYDGAALIAANFHKQYGFAVRCVKD